MAELGRRRPEAVRELELLQQQERVAVGEPALAPEQFRNILREDVLQRLVGEQLDAGGLDAFIAGAGDLDARADAEVAHLLQVWHVDEPDQWSRFETPATRWAIARTCARVEEVFARQGWQLSEVPVVGTLTTGQVAAVTQRTASGAPILLIDNGFFRFSGTISQLAVLTYDPRFRTLFADATLQLVSDLVATQTVLRTCLYLYHRPTPAEVRAEVDSFQDAVTLFLLGHEYAHISRGDLDAHPQSGPKPDATLRAREFAADRAGFIVALQAASGAAGAAGPFLYFCGLDLVARAEAAYRGKPPVIETTSPDQYPTPFERTIKLLEWIDSRAKLASARAAAHDAAARYNTILFVWDRVHPVFAALRHELAQYDPARIGNEPVLPEVATFGLVSQLWQAVRAATR
jgi:hypothetical protein